MSGVGCSTAVPGGAGLSPVGAGVGSPAPTAVSAAGSQDDDRDAGCVAGWSQARVDAVFYALVGDLAGAPQEIIDPHTGRVEGRVIQSLYGQRAWVGSVSSPLLFAGQFVDAESGWAYNRFRFYSPVLAGFNAQDPLGLAPRIASAQGYVDHAAYWVDIPGLKAHEAHRKALAPSFIRKELSTHPPTSMDAYRMGRGHHTPLKSTYSVSGDGQSVKYGAPAVDEQSLADAYNAGKAPSEHLTGSQVHQKISKAQNMVFRNSTMRELTWENVVSHEIKAHTQAGIPENVASTWLDTGVEYLRNQGISQPTRWPWGNN